MQQTAMKAKGNKIESEEEPIRALVHEIGKRLARNKEEIERATQLLDDHWIGTLADWSRLSLDHRKEVGLPLLLSSSLDELVLERETSTQKRTPASLRSLPTCASGTSHLQYYILKICIFCHSLVQLLWLFPWC
jgi:hypothetical protein